MICDYVIIKQETNHNDHTLLLSSVLIYYDLQFSIPWRYIHVVLEHQIFEGYWLMLKQNCNDIEEEMLQWKQAKIRPNVRDDDQKVLPQANSTVEFFIVQSIRLTPP